MITNGCRRFHKKTEPDDTSEQHRRILGNAKQEQRGAARCEHQRSGVTARRFSRL